jgi:hypothetical protein
MEGGGQVGASEGDAHWRCWSSVVGLRVFGNEHVGEADATTTQPFQCNPSSRQTSYGTEVAASSTGRNAVGSTSRHSPSDARETIACDYYIDAMDDADFALKIRERAPTTLDEALRIALQLEAWQQDVRRSRADDYNQLKPKLGEQHRQPQWSRASRRNSRNSISESTS